MQPSAHTFPNPSLTSARTGRSALVARTVVATAVAIALLVASLAVAPAHAQSTGDLDALPTFLDDIAGQFDALALRPDGLGFSLGTSPDPEQCKHYQGIARVQGPDGTPYMFVSRSGNEPSFPASVNCSNSDDPGNLLIVEMGSRDKSAERMRSNRFRRGWSIYPRGNGDPNTYWRTPPDPRDTVTRTIYFDGTDGWPDYGHPGGMQVIGDVLVLALETSYGDEPDNRIMFLDVSDPLSPQILSQFDPPDVTSEFGAGLVGITAVRTDTGQCCRYLMVAAGKHNKEVRFYRSLPTPGSGTASDLTSPALGWEEVGRYTESQLEACLGGVAWHTGVGDAHQMLNFVRQANLNGPLMLIGGRNTTPLPSGDDMIDLYRVHVSSTGLPGPCVITHERTTQVTSHPYHGGGDSANFAAASGVYVSPSGELIIYAAEYENDGPQELLPDGTAGSQTVRFAEYRHRNIVRPENPTLRPTVTVDGSGIVQVDEGSTVGVNGTGGPPTTKAWIQLFEDDDAGASLPSWYDGDQWVTVDYPDRDADDFDTLVNVHRLRREDAGSWRWFAPVGCTIEANDYGKDVPADRWPGPDSILLHGTGQVEEETDLDRIDFDDDLGGITFGLDCEDYYNAPIEVAWDLDGDGIFETSGPNATIDASRLDGPTARTVWTRGQHPTDPTELGRGVPVDIEVRVRNVAPRVTRTSMIDAVGNEVGSGVPFVLPGQPVDLTVEFTDPGYFDTQTAVVDWGDGSVDSEFDEFTDARHGRTGILRHTHTFYESGSHTVTITVTDDDGGVRTAQRRVDVLTPEDAIELVVELIDGLLLWYPDPPAADLLTRARNALAGNQDGTADNGALDALAADDPATAITKLSSAIDHLAEAEKALSGDLGPLRKVLGNVAWALAVSELDAAIAAVSPPSHGQQRQLDAIADLIGRGRELLLADDFADACSLFRQAVVKAQALAG